MRNTDTQLATTTSQEARMSLAPGDWTPTGWGAQHRVRCSDEQWTELVCHTTGTRPDRITPGPTHRCETARIDRDANDGMRCLRCDSLPDLGPLRCGPLGEVRRSPDGLVAVASGHVGLDRRWKLIGEDAHSSCYGWRTDWDVASWKVIGNVYQMETTREVAA